MPVLSILNQKGGSGKTTLATNLADAFIKDHVSAKILDADPQRTATEWARLRPENARPTVTPTAASTIEKDVQEAVAQVIVVDGAPAVDTLNVRAVKLSDVVLIPVRASGPDIWSSEDLLEHIQTRREETGGRPDAAFVVCQQVARTNLAKEIGEVLEEYPFPTLDGRTNHRVAYAEALSSGATVLELSGAGKAEAEINAIADELLPMLKHKQ